MSPVGEASSARILASYVTVCRAILVLPEITCVGVPLFPQHSSRNHSLQSHHTLSLSSVFVPFDVQKVLQAMYSPASCTPCWFTPRRGDSHPSRPTLGTMGNLLRCLPYKAVRVTGGLCGRAAGRWPVQGQFPSFLLHDTAGRIYSTANVNSIEQQLPMS